MKLPSKIKIGGHWVTVIEADNPILDDQVKNGKQDYNNLIIEIKKDLPDTRKEQVFLHELMHFVYDMSGENPSEEFVERTSEWLYAVLKENDLLNWVKNNGNSR